MSFNEAAAIEQERIHGEHVHRCPEGSSNIFPCCGQTPWEVPFWHRMTVDPTLVTCHGGDHDG